jgi:hypothetical protein
MLDEFMVDDVLLDQDGDADLVLLREEVDRCRTSTR